MAIIEANGLSKTYRVYQKKEGLLGAVRGLFRREYKEVRAVENVSFTIDPGEIVGFLGPNGAGKTTTLKILSGLIYPTSGTAHVLGHVPWQREDTFRRRFSLVMGQKNQLWWDLPAADSFQLHREIYSLQKGAFERTLGELTELFGVKELTRQPVRELSLGERMKMELIASLLHKPKVLFLDEPTIGLDVVSQKTVREFLREHNKKAKTTIILTSHYMTDIQELCKRVIIIDRGVISFDGQLSEVVDRFADFKLITIQFEGTGTYSAEAVAKYGEIVEQKPGCLTLKVKRDRVIHACKALLDELPVSDIDIQEVPIEEVIRKIFAR